jgi:hypothetical protein
MSENDEIDWVKDFARQQVRAAFDGRETIVDLVCECIEDYGLTDELSSAQLVDAEIAALKAEQETWPDVTDTDRLELIFQTLSQRGIVPRHNFTCCGTCGAAEIGYEIEKEAAKGKDVKGYVFYHEQDTESAVDGYGLYFNYGAVGESASASDHIAIGEMLASALRENGFEVGWDNSLSRRVGLKLHWKRRWGSTSEFVQM